MYAQLVQLQFDINDTIAYMEATSEESWTTDVVRSADGSANCFFGHLFASAGGDEARANRMWDEFEWRWASTYMLYPVNDGTDSRYQQTSPKQRVLAYLRDLRDHRVKSSLDYDEQHCDQFEMSAEFEAFERELLCSGGLA
jgi:hypothetical protein